MIRVLIERRLATPVQEPLQQAMREIRSAALSRPGYVSGETLRDSRDPLHYFIISTWRSRADCETWLRSDARRRIAERIAPILAEPEKVTLLEPA